MTRRIVVISAGLGVPSSTRILADQLGAATAGALRSRGESVQVDVVELRGLAHALADALVAVTPVFSASYSGLFKTFFDVLEPGLLEGKPVLLAATAGTARHSLVLEHALRPLFAHLRATPTPTAVFAASEDFGSTAGGRLATRIDRAAGELASLVVGAGPARPPQDDFVSFEELLHR